MSRPDASGSFPPSSAHAQHALFPQLTVGLCSRGSMGSTWARITSTCSSSGFWKDTISPTSISTTSDMPTLPWWSIWASQGKWSPSISVTAAPGQRKISTPMCLQRRWRRLRTPSHRHWREWKNKANSIRRRRHRKHQGSSTGTEWHWQMRESVIRVIREDILLLQWKS